MRRMYSKPQLLEAVEQEAKTNGIKVFEDIVDKDGHARFIEGDITGEVITGVSYSYTKWSLSGSHLLIVICGNLTAANNIGDNTTVAKLMNIPEWVRNKIIPIAPVSNPTVVSTITMPFYSSGYNILKKDISLMYFNDELVVRNISGNITDSVDRTFRIAFDLLIDNN